MTETVIPAGDDGVEYGIYAERGEYVVLSGVLIAPSALFILSITVGDLTWWQSMAVAVGGTIGGAIVLCLLVGAFVSAWDGLVMGWEAVAGFFASRRNREVPPNRTTA
jgi:hypothetical protein